MITETKCVSEVLSLEFDFLNRCGITEVVVEYDASIKVVSGVDPMPATMISTDGEVATKAVWLPVAGGLPGVVYSIAVAARTNRNNVYVVQTLVAVKTDMSE